MYSCFINSTIAQANENNHSSKIAFFVPTSLSLLLKLHLWVVAKAPFGHQGRRTIFCLKVFCSQVS